jgi:hypothetical protein
MAKYPELQTFYASDAWRNFRIVIINERGPTCEHCNRRIACSEDITLHHHPIELTPDNYMDTTISLNPENILVVCHACHNILHRRNAKQSMKRGVYLVYGPPLSGKKTFVQKNKWPGDLVLDMDAIFYALSLQPWYDKPDILLPNVRAVHNQVLDNIKTRFGRWDSAWVIGGYPEKYKREKLATDLGATLIYCQATKDECLERLNSDAGRCFRKKEWQGYIDKWFVRYSE